MNQPNLHSELPFLPFVKALEAISSIKQKTTRKTEDKKHYLKGYLSAFNEAKQKFIEKHRTESYTSFYPILRLLLPFQDKTRSYGIKETALGRIYTQMLALGAKSSDAMLLKTGTLNKPGTDFGDVIYEVMKDRTKPNGVCKIIEINEFLDKLSNSDINEGKAAFMKIFPHLTTLEHKWIARIILKSMKLDLTESAILSVMHPKAGNMINQVFSLEKLCQILESGKEITDELINNQSIDPFVPLRPQLCDRMVQNQINAILERQEMYAETKMDGERMQMHKKGDEYRYFTRHGNDCSVQFGIDHFSGCFTPFVHQFFRIPITNMILDGEMMVWDRNEVRFVVKGENISARTMKNHEKYQSCFVVYDILYLNDQNLISTEYQKRIDILNQLFTDVPGHLMKVRRQIVRSCTEVLEVLNKAIDDQEEGIVLKQIDSVYKPGKRGEGWFKVKPDYLGDLITDLDLVIIGAEHKKGTSYIQKYFVAIKDDRKSPVKYVTVTPIVNNLSYDDSKIIHGILDPVKKLFDPTKMPSHLDFGYYRPHLYYEPSESVIVEVKASELQKSSSVSTGYILRFPRITRIRQDKPPTDCCDVREFMSLCGRDIEKVESGEKVIKLPKRHATESDLVTTHRRSAPKRQKIDPVQKINPYTTTNDVEILDNIAKGLQICVLSSGKGKNFPPKEELERRVRMHGGQVVALPGRNTNFCVAHTETPMVLSIKQNKSHTIVSIPWFLKAFPINNSLETLPPITRKDTLSMKLEFESQLKSDYDENDDHYTKELTKNELDEHLKDMQVICPLLLTEYDELERVIIGRKDIYNMFRGKFAFFDTDLYASADYKIAKLLFISRSGTVESELENVDEGEMCWIVVDKTDVDKLKISKELVRNKNEMKGVLKLVDYQYFVQISKGFVPELKDYLLK